MYRARSARTYSALAPWYDWLVWPLRHLRQEVVRLSGLPPGARVLDAATGTGEQALAFAQVARAVVGVDASEAMLEVARSKRRGENVTFMRGDVARLPFESSSFDASCISFALHELPRPMRVRALRELARVTRPGGPVVVVDYALPRHRLARWVAFQLVRLYEREPYEEFVELNLEALLARAGLGGAVRHRAMGGLAVIITARRADWGWVERADGPGRTAA